MAWTDCGVRPTWPITGMPALTMRCTCSATGSPPSSFTASKPPSFIILPACSSAFSLDTWKLMNGMSPTTCARRVARATARPW